MSPTSYQAAPPRVFILRDFALIRNSRGCGVILANVFPQKGINPYRGGEIQLVLLALTCLTHQVLYAVPSNREVSGECECTSTIPVTT
jgi:hypothetical protein